MKMQLNAAVLVVLFTVLAGTAFATEATSPSSPTPAVPVAPVAPVHPPENPEFAKQLAEYDAKTDAIVKAVEGLKAKDCSFSTMYWLSKKPADFGKGVTIQPTDLTKFEIGCAFFQGADGPVNDEGVYLPLVTNFPDAGTDAADLIVIVEKKPTDKTHDKAFCDYVNDKVGVQYDYTPEAKRAWSWTKLQNPSDLPFVPGSAPQLEAFKGKTSGCLYTGETGYTYFKLIQSN